MSSVCRCAKGPQIVSIPLEDDAVNCLTWVLGTPNHGSISPVTPPGTPRPPHPTPSTGVFISPPKLSFRVLPLKPVKWPYRGGTEEPLVPGRGANWMSLGPTATKLISTEAREPETNRNVRKEARA